MMKILLVAPITDYPETLGRFCLNALCEQGHEVSHWDYRRTQEIHGYFNVNDFTLVIKGVGLSPSAWDQFPRPVVLWFPDEYFYHTEYLLAIRKKVDHFFFGNKHEERIMKKFDAEWLPFAYDPHFHAPLPNCGKEHDERWVSDLCFVGTAHPTRLGWMGQFTKYDLSVWGNGWEGTPFKPLQYRGYAVYGKVKMRAYCGAKIVLNHHFMAAGPNMRTFEALAAGCLLLTDDKPGVRDFFEHERDLLIYRDPKHADELIKFYLKNEYRRAQVAIQGQKTAKPHTYGKRMEELMERIGL